MDLSVERGSDIPLGTQLTWKLRAAIASGALRPGDRLPAVRELAAEARVNVNTARAVYARLAEQGAIVSEHGRGTFVANAPGGGAGLAQLVERQRELRAARQRPRASSVDERSAWPELLALRPAI